MYGKFILIFMEEKMHFILILKDLIKINKSKTSLGGISFYTKKV